MGVLIWPLILIQQTNYDVAQIDFRFDDSGKLLDVSSRKGQFTKSLLSVGDAFSEKQKEAEERIKEEMKQIGRPFSEEPKDASLAYLAI